MIALRGGEEADASGDDSDASSVSFFLPRLEPEILLILLSSGAAAIKQVSTRDLEERDYIAVGTDEV